MAEFELLGVKHTRFRDVKIIGSVSGEQLAESLSPILISHRMELGIDNASTELHALASTSVSTPFNGSKYWQDAQRVFDQHLGCQFGFLTNAYECASWGYILRFLGDQFESGTQVAISIVDVKIRNFSFWNDSDLWGASGWGVTTLKIKVGQQGLKVCEAAKVNALADFCMNVKRAMKGKEDLQASLPFFPETTRQLNDRILKGCNRFPDLHEQYGHCFGSDPWIGLVENQPRLGSEVLVGSFALSGYWAICHIRISENCPLLKEELNFSCVSSNQSVKQPVSDSKYGEQVSKVDYRNRGEFIVSYNRNIPLYTVEDFKSVISIENPNPIISVATKFYDDLSEKLRNLKFKEKQTIVRVPAPMQLAMGRELLNEKVFCSATPLLNIHYADFNLINLDCYQPYVNDCGGNSERDSSR